MAFSTRFAAALAAFALSLTLFGEGSAHAQGYESSSGGAPPARNGFQLAAMTRAMAIAAVHGTPVGGFREVM
jgi:hypothetical protein